MYHSDGDVDNGGGYVSVGKGTIWEILFSAHCCCELKIALKNKFYFLEITFK